MPTRARRHPHRMRDPQHLVDQLRRAAAAAARAGYCVFPVKPRRKAPAIENWEHAATRSGDHHRLVDPVPATSASPPAGQAWSWSTWTTATASRRRRRSPAPATGSTC